MKTENTFRNIVIRNTCNLIQLESEQACHDPVVAGDDLVKSGDFKLGYTLTAMSEILHMLDLDHEQLLILNELHAVSINLNKESI